MQMSKEVTSHPREKATQIKPLSFYSIFFFSHSVSAFPSSLRPSLPWWLFPFPTWMYPHPRPSSGLPSFPPPFPSYVSSISSPPLSHFVLIISPSLFLSSVPSPLALLFPDLLFFSPCVIVPSLSLSSPFSHISIDVYLLWLFLFLCVMFSPLLRNFPPLAILFSYILSYLPFFIHR